MRYDRLFDEVGLARRIPPRVVGRTPQGRRARRLYVVRRWSLTAQNDKARRASAGRRYPSGEVGSASGGCALTLAAARAASFTLRAAICSSRAFAIARASSSTTPSVSDPSRPILLELGQDCPTIALSRLPRSQHASRICGAPAKRFLKLGRHARQGADLVRFGWERLRPSGAQKLDCLPCLLAAALPVGVGAHRGWRRTVAIRPVYRAR